VPAGFRVRRRARPRLGDAPHHHPVAASSRDHIELCASPPARRRRTPTREGLDRRLDRDPDNSPATPRMAGEEVRAGTWRAARACRPAGSSETEDHLGAVRGTAGDQLAPCSLQRHRAGARALGVNPKVSSDGRPARRCSSKRRPAWSVEQALVARRAAACALAPRGGSRWHRAPRWRTALASAARRRSPRACRHLDPSDSALQPVHVGDDGIDLLRCSAGAPSWA
jgi:hypothetical protein